MKASPAARDYFPALDGLRAVAVILVFCQHYVMSQISLALSWGWTGVDIFFVLSGFLITGILYDSRHLPHRYRNFYVRRALRIFPLYYGVFLLILLLTPLLHWNWNALWLLWPIYLGNLNRFFSFPFYGHMGLDALQSANTELHIYLGHFWSLCVEEQFYLIWPFVVFRIGDRRRLLQLCLAVIVLSPVLRGVTLLFLPGEIRQAEFFYRLLPFRSDALLIGAAVALLRRGPAWPTVVRYTRPALLVLAAFFLIARFVGVSVLHQTSFSSPATPWISTIGYSLLDLFFGGVIILCLDPRSLLTRCLAIRPLIALGQISYGFYVLHDIPQFAYELLVAHFFHVSTHVISLSAAAIAFPTTILLAALSFRFFESPFLRLKDRFTLRSVVPSPHP